MALTPQKCPARRCPEVPRRFPGGSPKVPGGSPEVIRTFPGGSPEVPGESRGRRRSRIFERFFGGSLASPVFRSSSEAPGNFQKTELADSTTTLTRSQNRKYFRLSSATPETQCNFDKASSQRQTPKPPLHSFCILYCNDIPTHGKVLVRRFATIPKDKSGEKRKQGPSWPMQVCSVCGIKVVP